MGSPPTLSGFEWTVILTVGAVMWGGLLYFVKRWMESVDERLANESKLRNKDLEGVRGTVSGLDDDFRAFELMVAREYTARAHLVEALAPLTERMESFRRDIKELFTLVHTKQDRRAGAD